MDTIMNPQSKSAAAHAHDFGLQDQAGSSASLSSAVVEATKLKAQFLADLQACADANIEQEPLWNSPVCGTEMI
jgi:hypothetical protein